MQLSWDIYKIYTLSQWVFFFLLYAVIGWIWETGYVSVKKHAFENRGFMHGPMLPIYGFGALSILLATLPASGHVPFIFLLGMTAATLLELITGALMEALFHVRYWDYTEKKANVKGYICLGSSLGWGFFSVLLVKLIHPPVSKLVTQIPEALLQVFTLVLLLAATADFTVSFVEAMDFRYLLENLAQNTESLRRLRMRMDVIRAVMDDNVENFKASLAEKMRLEAEELIEKASANKEKLSEKLGELQKRLAAVTENRKGLKTGRAYMRSLRIWRRNPTISTGQRTDLKEALKELAHRNKKR